MPSCAQRVGIVMSKVDLSPVAHSRHAEETPDAQPTRTRRARDKAPAEAASSSSPVVVAATDSLAPKHESKPNPFLAGVGRFLTNDYTVGTAVLAGTVGIVDHTAGILVAVAGIANALNVFGNAGRFIKHQASTLADRLSSARDRQAAERAERVEHAAKNERREPVLKLGTPEGHDAHESEGPRFTLSRGTAEDLAPEPAFLGSLKLPPAKKRRAAADKPSAEPAADKANISVRRVADAETPAAASEPVARKAPRSARRVATAETPTAATEPVAAKASRSARRVADAETPVVAPESVASKEPRSARRAADSEKPVVASEPVAVDPSTSPASTEAPAAETAQKRRRTPAPRYALDAGLMSTLGRGASSAEADSAAWRPRRVD